MVRGGEKWSGEKWILTQCKNGANKRYCCETKWCDVEWPGVKCMVCGCVD